VLVPHVEDPVDRAPRRGDALERGRVRQRRLALVLVGIGRVGVLEVVVLGRLELDERAAREEAAELARVVGGDEGVRDPLEVAVAQALPLDEVLRGVESNVSIRLDLGSSSKSAAASTTRTRQGDERTLTSARRSLTDGSTTTFCVLSSMRVSPTIGATASSSGSTSSPSPSGSGSASAQARMTSSGWFQL